MDKRIKELAEQAGLHIANNREGRALVFGNQAHVHVLFDELERFADLVRQDAMEEAAKICDELNYNGMNSLHCAQAIRNRAEEINDTER